MRQEVLSYGLKFQTNQEESQQTEGFTRTLSFLSDSCYPKSCTEAADLTAGVDLEQTPSNCNDSSGKASVEGNETAVSGQSATLSCRYSLPERVRQVLWKKTAEQGDSTTVASYGKHGQLRVGDQFRQRVSLSRSLDETQLTITQVRTVDEACYTCEFHTYPDGTKSATSCLSVYGEHLTL